MTSGVSRPKFTIAGEPADGQKVFSEFREKYQNDIVSFVTEFLEEVPTRAQKRLLKAVLKHRRVARATGHGVGKTTCIRWIALHQILFVPDIKILILSSQEDQVRQSVFDETIAIAQRHKTPDQKVKSSFLQFMLKMTRQNIVPWDNPFGAGIYIKSPSKSNPNSVAGIRGDNRTLIICDEAQAIEDPVYAALRGVMASIKVSIILLGNPLFPTGYFYDVFNTFTGWDTEHWSCIEHSTRYCIDHRFPLAERLVDDAWIDQAKMEMSEAEYASRVMGQFPTDTTSSLVGPVTLSEAFGRPVDETGAIIWSMDLAGEGADNTVFVCRKGNLISEVTTVPHGETSSRWIFNRYRSAKDSEKPDVIFYDLTGVGQTFREAVKNIPGGDALPIRGVNFGSVDYLVEPDKFVNNKAEIFWRLKLGLENGEIGFSSNIDKATWELIRKQALAHKFDITEKGKTAVESKSKVRAKLKGRSPDQLDAVSLTFTRAKVLKKVRHTGRVEQRAYVARY